MWKIKKIFLIVFLVLFFYSLFPQQIQAAFKIYTPKPLVPCGPGTANPNCEFCHLFVLFNNIVEFVLFGIVPSLAVLMIVIGGFLYFFAGQDPAMLTRAKSIFISVAIGLLIIFGAWIVVNTFFAIIGITSWTGEWLKFPGAWFKVNCSAP